MTTEYKEAEAVDYVFNNMEYDWSEIEEKLKEAIRLTLNFKEKEIIKIMDEIKHKEKNFVNMWYSLERELRIKQNNREKLKGDKE